MPFPFVRADSLHGPGQTSPFTGAGPAPPTVARGGCMSVQPCPVPGVAPGANLQGVREEPGRGLARSGSRGSPCAMVKREGRAMPSSLVKLITELLNLSRGETKSPAFRRGFRGGVTGPRHARHLLTRWHPGLRLGVYHTPLGLSSTSVIRSGPSEYSTLFDAFRRPLSNSAKSGFCWVAGRIPRQ